MSTMSCVTLNSICNFIYLDLVLECYKQLLQELEDLSSLMTECVTRIFMQRELIQSLSHLLTSHINAMLGDFTQACILTLISSGGSKNRICPHFDQDWPFHMDIIICVQSFHGETNLYWVLLRKHGWIKYEFRKKRMQNICVVYCLTSSCRLECIIFSNGSASVRRTVLQGPAAVGISAFGLEYFVVWHL